MTTPRMRTAEGALSILKETDPGTAVTLRFIRRLIVTGAVPHVPVGRKKLVDVDRLMDYLKGGNPIWVQGEEGAKAFMVAPGNSVMLMDSENTVFYLKSSDQSGMPLPLRIFDYTERTSNQPKQPPAPQFDPSQFITRDELENILAERLKKPARPAKPKEDTEHE